jgi:EmrB/QacA subfamily drug resistance transporter
VFSSKENFALLIAVLSAFLTPFVGSSINIALPAIGLELGANPILLGWVPTIYLLSLAVFAVPFGRLADLYGRKKVFTYGVIIFTISSFLAIFSSSIEILLVFRILQGLGAAMIFSTMAAIVVSIFPPGVRGKALGITMTGVFLGLFLGPVLGGLLTQYLTWKSLFLFNVPLGILIIIGLTKIRKEWAEARGESFDFGGTVVLALSLIALMAGISILPDYKGLILVIIGLLGFGLFYKLEERIEHPVFNFQLFKNKVFALNNIANFINFSAAAPLTFLMSLYLQYIIGFDPRTAGFFLAIQPIVMVIVSPLAGKLSDDMEPVKVATLAMILNSIGLLILSLLGTNSNILLVIIALIVLGAGFALFTSPNTNIIMSNVEQRFYGIASATISTMRVIGQMIGMGAALLCLSIFLGSANVIPANYGDFILSLKIFFIMFSLFSLFGALICWKSRKT